MSAPQHAIVLPVLTHNPLVQTQRSGWCVKWEHRDRAGNVTERWMHSMWSVLPQDTKGWQGPDKAHVFAQAHEAHVRAKAIGGCMVTNVPRHNGHGYEWHEVEA